jgi:hypothetical protein
MRTVGDYKNQNKIIRWIGVLFSARTASARETSFEIRATGAAISLSNTELLDTVPRAVACRNHLAVRPVDAY